MNVANLGLCKKLHELSGWRTPYFYTEKTEGKDVEYQYIRYDSGFLLRKLPVTIHLNKGKLYSVVWSNDKDHHTFTGITPEDCLAKLAIELFKQGILKGD